MSSNSVLENLRKQWSQYNSPAGTTTSSKPSMPKQQVRQPTLHPKPQPTLRTQFNSECYRCRATVVFNTIWWDDFKNCYIPLEPDSMVEHRCKKTYARNSKLQAQIFHTF